MPVANLCRIAVLSNKPNQHSDSRKALWEGIGINKKRLRQKNQEVANM